MKNVLVTAFIKLYNNGCKRDYLSLMKWFIDIDTPRVLFISKQDADSIGLVETPSLRVIFTTYNDLEYTQYHVRQIPEIIHLNKTIFLAKACKLNAFGLDHYIWVDSGLQYIVDTKHIHQLPFLSIPDICAIGYRHALLSCPISEEQTWFFFGCILGGNSRSLLALDIITRRIILHYIENYRMICFREVDAWHAVYLLNQCNQCFNMIKVPASTFKSQLTDFVEYFMLNET